MTARHWNTQPADKLDCRHDCDSETGTAKGQKLNAGRLKTPESESANSLEYIYRIRGRFHPLNHLRRHAFARAVLQAIDVPVWTRLPKVSWKVRVRLVRHACYFALPAGPEPGVSNLFCSIVRHCRIQSFWDVGANIGYYSWLVKSLMPSAHVRMFEPEPDNLWLVGETISRNAILGVTLREVAASDARGICWFARDWISGSTGGVLGDTQSYSERQWRVTPRKAAVTALLLDDERRIAGRADLIKIDVEGHEEAVIRGALETIRSDQPILIIECFHGGRELITALQHLGYVFLDAERMTSVRSETTNFLALPKPHQPILERWGVASSNPS
jgi:FkbM family methyltransferase